MSLLTKNLKRNHQLYKENYLYKRLNLCLIRDNDNAFQRNMEAVKYIDENLKRLDDWTDTGVKLESVIREYQRLRQILTTFKTDNILDEVNK